MPTRVRTLVHLEACLAAVLGLAALAALPAGAQRAAVAARLALSVTLAAAFLGCLAALGLGRLAAARGTEPLARVLEPLAQPVLLRLGGGRNDVGGAGLLVAAVLPVLLGVGVWVQTGEVC